MNSERLLRRFLSYVQTDSESGDEKRFCELIENEVLRLGFKLTRTDISDNCQTNGYNIHGYMDGEGEPILLCAHLDTVPPGKGIKPKVDGGIIRSSGDTVLGADDKAGVAAILEAVEAVLEKNSGHRPVELLFTVCEETGLYGSKYADYSLIRSKRALVLDHGEPDSVVISSPSNYNLYCKIKGKSAHAAICPENGIHALKAAVKAVNSIPCGRVDEKTVINVSNFLAPGKTNIVPDLASFDIEVRSFDETNLAKHIENIEQTIKAACEEIGATFELKKEHIFSILNVPEQSPFVQELVNAYKELGIKLKVEKTQGGSDAAWLFHHGIMALNLGVGMNDVHSCTESIAIADLELTAKALESIIARV